MNRFGRVKIGTFRRLYPLREVEGYQFQSPLSDLSKEEWPGDGGAGRKCDVLNEESSSCQK